MSEPEELDEIETELLLEGVFRRYAFDFRQYSRAMVRRRLRRRVAAEKTGTISGLQERVLHDPACFERLLLDLSITVTAMFRDPAFYRAFRAKVVPLLRTYPSLRIWNAGCSTGEEVFSMAILLQEEGLYERARIYATDINDAVLTRAQAGEFPLPRMSEYTGNYLKAGGREAFSTYYSTDGEVARFDRSLVRNVVFARHNLVSDGVFNEFNAIVCRNVLIYFSRELQEHVQRLFDDSLGRFGVLALGAKEGLRSHGYQELDGQNKLYKRVR